MPSHIIMLMNNVQLPPPVHLGNQRPAGNQELTGTVLEVSYSIPKALGSDTFFCEGKYLRAVRLCSVPASSPLGNCSDISNSKIICFHEKI